jgi:Ala-tRNA(Pro) deacylase
VVLPADYVVNFGEVLRLLGLTHIRMATEAELADLFPECELGAMPPLGNLFDMPVLVDENLAEEGVITFNAGTHRDVVHMKFADYRDLVNPLVAKFGVREEVAVAC